MTETVRILEPHPDDVVTVQPPSRGEMESSRPIDAASVVDAMDIVMKESKIPDGTWRNAPGAALEPVPGERAVVYQYMKPDGTWSGWDVHLNRRKPKEG